MRRHLLAVLPALVLAGCGNAVGDIPPLAGLTGIEVDEAGGVTVVVHVCREGVRSISVVGDREGLAETEENEQVALYEAGADLDGRVTLDLGMPSDGWTPRTPTALDPDEGYVIGAEGGQGSDEETQDVWVAAGRLADLRPGVSPTSGRAGPTSPTPPIPTPAPWHGSRRRPSSGRPSASAPSTRDAARHVPALGRRPRRSRPSTPGSAPSSRLPPRIVGLTIPSPELGRRAYCRDDWFARTPHGRCGSRGGADRSLRRRQAGEKAPVTGDGGCLDGFWP